MNFLTINLVLLGEPFAACAIMTVANAAIVQLVKLGGGEEVTGQTRHRYCAYLA